MRTLGFHILYLLSLSAAWYAGATSIKPLSESPSASKEALSTVLGPRSTATSKCRKGFLEEIANGDRARVWSVIHEWVKSDPQGAIAELTQGEDCGPLMRWLMSLWGAASSRDANKWLDGQKGTAHYDWAVEGLLVHISQAEPEKILGLIRSVDDSSIRASLWFSKSACDVMRHDIDLAETALSESRLPEDLQRLVRKQWTTVWDSRIHTIVMRLNDYLSDRDRRHNRLDLSEPDNIASVYRDLRGNFNLHVGFPIFLNSQETQAVLKRLNPEGTRFEPVKRR